MTLSEIRDTYCKDCKGLIICQTIKKFCEEVVEEVQASAVRESIGWHLGERK